MSQFIKFPTQIDPSRVTINLARVDEISKSPLTSAQQVLSRGNPAWVWTYNYVDLTEDERDIVQAFLLKCQGPVNSFKVTDPGDYGSRGSTSGWIDIFSGYGDFAITAGSGSLTVNSWWSKQAHSASHIDENQTLRMEWIDRPSIGTGIGYRGHDNNYDVNSLEIGKAYAYRMKLFLGPKPHHIALNIGCINGTSIEYVGMGPASYVQSDDCFTVPFTPVNTTHRVSQAHLSSNQVIGDYWHEADHRLSRVALVSNSENLLIRSNEFDSGWSNNRSIVDSGYSDASPTGVTSGAWMFFTANTNVNTAHNLIQTYSKVMTEDLYTASIYAKAAALSEMQLRIDDSASAAAATAIFWLNSGTVDEAINSGLGEKAVAAIFDVGSGWYRCQLTTMVSSLNHVRHRFYLANGTDISITGTGSDGIEIFGAQLRKHPFMGHYVPTTDAVVVGTDWQTGSKLYVDGFNPRDIIKANQRFEVVNRFYNQTSGDYERSEFKKITQEILVHREGYAILPFEPSIRNAPVTARNMKYQSQLGETLHNPVIFHQPELKARLAESSIKYIDKALKATDISFSIVEDLTE